MVGVAVAVGRAAVAVAGRVDMGPQASSSGEAVRVVRLGTEAEDGEHRAAGHSRVISSRSSPDGDRYHVCQQ